MRPTSRHFEGRLIWILQAACESDKGAIVASLSSMIVEDLKTLDNVGPVSMQREVMPQAPVHFHKPRSMLASCGRYNLENVRYKSTLTRQRAF